MYINVCSVCIYMYIRLGKAITLLSLLLKHCYVIFLLAGKPDIRVSGPICPLSWLQRTSHPRRRPSCGDMIICTHNILVLFMFSQCTYNNCYLHSRERERERESTLYLCMYVCMSFVHVLWGVAN